MFRLNALLTILYFSARNVINLIHLSLCSTVLPKAALFKQLNIQCFRLDSEWDFFL